VPPPPRAAAGGGARPSRGLTDEVESVVRGRGRWESCEMGTARLQNNAHHRLLRRPWRLAAARPPQTRRGASPRRDRGHQTDHEAAAAATACALARGNRTFGGRWRARSGGWMRQRRVR